MFLKTLSGSYVTVSIYKPVFFSFLLLLLFYGNIHLNQSWLVNYINLPINHHHQVLNLHVKLFETDLESSICGNWKASLEDCSVDVGAFDILFLSFFLWVIYSR